MIGQKVNPVGFRLNQKYMQGAVRSPRVEKHSKGNKVSKEHSEDRFETGHDRWGWSHSSVSSTSKDYGNRLNLLSNLTDLIEETSVAHGRRTNRISTCTSAREGIKVRVEVYHPRTPTMPSNRRANLQRGLEIEGKLRMRHYGNLPRKREILDLGELRKDKQLNEGRQDRRKRGDTAGRSKKRAGPVSREGLCGVFALAAIHPVPTRRSKRIGMRLEDAVSQSEVRSMRQARVNGLSENPIRGRRQYLENVDDLDGIENSLAKRVGSYLGRRIVVKGCIDGGRRTRSEVIEDGTLPRSSVRAARVAAKTQAKTKTGTRGVRVTYCY